MSHPGLQFLHLGCGESLNCVLFKGLAFRSRGIFCRAAERHSARKHTKVYKTKK